MSCSKNFVLDDGYRYGLGAFETILVKNGKAVLLPYHTERLINALGMLQIPVPGSFERELEHKTVHMPEGKDVLRVSVSQNNTVWETRTNPYTAQHYNQGFSLTYCTARRNETSIMTKIKSLNQGDNILQRRLALSRGFDEAIFLNSKGELTEGTVSNIFFVSGGKLYTPSACCGLLAGTVRRWLIESFDVSEIRILPQDAGAFQEMFVTNALLGVVPVRELDTVIFSQQTATDEIRRRYDQMLQN